MYVGPVPMILLTVPHCTTSLEPFPTTYCASEFFHSYHRAVCCNTCGMEFHDHSTQVQSLGVRSAQVWQRSESQSIYYCPASIGRSSDFVDVHDIAELVPHYSIVKTSYNKRSEQGPTKIFWAFCGSPLGGFLDVVATSCR